MSPVDRANKLVSELIEAGWIENDMKALALISAIAPVVRDAEIDMAERAAKEMQEICISTACYQCACGHELIDGQWHRQGTETLISCGARDIRALDPAAIARRAVDAAANAESAHDKMPDASNEMAADRGREK